MSIHSKVLFDKFKLPQVELTLSLKLSGRQQICMSCGSPKTCQAQNDIDDERDFLQLKVPETPLHQGQQMAETHPECDSLHQGVCEDQYQGGCAQGNAVVIELHQNAQAKEQLNPEKACIRDCFCLSTESRVNSCGKASYRAHILEGSLFPLPHFSKTQCMSSI